MLGMKARELNSALTPIRSSKALLNLGPLPLGFLYTGASTLFLLFLNCLLSHQVNLTLPNLKDGDS
jgi:hypothetical protein